MHATLVFIAFSCLFLKQSTFAQTTSKLSTIKSQLALLKPVPFKSTPEMIQAEGYPAESYYVTTSDGYILNIHRIPRGKTGKKNNKVAFLLHGSLCSSSDWVLFGPGNSLGYVLADEGYDVWMGNIRGNTYSRNHITLNPDRDAKFWNYTWHEMGYIDVPTMLDFILVHTGADGVYYVGHSQGTTAFYVLAAAKPEYNAKIKAHISLAPIVYVGHLTSPLLRIIANWQAPVELLFRLIGLNEFLPNRGFLTLLENQICSTLVGSILCENVLFALCGFDPWQINITRVPLIVRHAPAGASSKQIFHYVQEINSLKFRQYDYGLIGNLAGYGRLTPPEYDLKKIKVPVHLIYGRNDWLSSVEDVDQLARELPNLKEKHLIPYKTWEHMDYIYANDAPELVHKEVVRMLGEYK